MLIFDFGTRQELQLLGLLIAGAALLILAGPLNIPYPILLVLGGLLLAFGPGVPKVTMPPEVVLVGILPPLLYQAAYATGLRELRRNLRPISLLAVGLVLLTTCGVAVVAHEITDLGWAEAFVLGAVVSPTDPIAATAIGRRLGVPRRLIDIIEGESLVNDGTALVLLRTAIVAAVAGSFSVWDAGWHLAVNIVGGIAVGLAVGYPIRRVRRVLDNPPLEVTIAFLTGYFAFLPAVGDRRLRRARRRHRRRLHGLVHARADDGADSPPGRGILGACSRSCSTCSSSAWSACSCARCSTGSPATAAGRSSATPQ